MPNWNKVHDEINTLRSQGGEALDVVRRKYLKKLRGITGRNTIAYYSGWLQKGNLEGCIIKDDDKNGFMTTIHEMDRSKGLDLLLHTPGGSVAATESIVHYLHSMFDSNIRAIIPQLAMSGGTMIACACKEIVMGKQSNLGPIDPQYNGIPADGVVEEFKRAKMEIKKDPSTIPLWQAVLSKYHPTFIGECEKAIAWSRRIVEEWLISVMFKDERNAASKAKKAVKNLSSHVKHKSHDRHIHVDECRNILNVTRLEDLGDETQDIVLTVHHTYMHTFAGSTAIKIIENHNGVAMVHHVAQIRKK